MERCSHVEETCIQLKDKVSTTSVKLSISALRFGSSGLTSTLRYEILGLLSRKYNLMASQRAKAVERRRVIIFGGQGSSNIFSSAAASTAEDDAKNSVAGTVLLSNCHAAFLKDSLSIDLDSRRKIGVDASNFHELKDFLAPSQNFHNNAIVQSTTICLYQLLHYLVEITRLDLDFDNSREQILETTGFSSGLLPATVVATSRTIEEYVAFGVEAFRLAFWIACRTKLHGQMFTNTHDQMESWSLVVLGLHLMELQARLTEFHEQVSIFVIYPGSQAYLSRRTEGAFEYL